MARPNGPRPSPDTEWWAPHPGSAASADAPPDPLHAHSFGRPRGHQADGLRPKRRALPIALLTLLLLLVGIPVGVAVMTQGPTPTQPQATAPAEPSEPEDPAESAEPAEPAEPASGNLPQDAVPAVVIAIVDGDTLDTDQGRVRVFGVDTPEVGQPYADEATEKAESLVPVSSTIHLWRSPGSDDRDRFGRLVRTVLTADGVDLGAELVRGGLATAFRRYSDEYVAQELEAQQSGRGQWRGISTDTPSIAPLADAASSGAANEPWNEPGPDLDCADIGQPVQVAPPDYHRLDRDGDGWACEWSSR